ncbi:glycosyltransferase family 2 protein [Candidatus Bathyarchaeota archaeon]|nr:glycosyltransferase family 2 protein [Candidatus Bathyarchaeota archaeon]
MSSRKEKMVSIIIISYNRKEDVLDCLDSVMRLDYPNYEIIVVDNGSTDGSFQALLKKRDNIKLIETGLNLGNAAAINIGFKKSKGEFFLVLNDDIILQQDAVAELVRVMESNSQIGIAGSLTYFFEEPDKIWFYPEEFLEERAERPYVEVLMAVGCSFMTRRSVVEEIGFFDEDYFAYHEEADFCFRAKKTGFLVVCALRSSVYHKISVQDPRREFSLVRAYYSNRNYFLFAKKNYLRSTERINYLFQSFIYYPYSARGKPILRHLPWITPIKALISLKVDFLIAYFRGISVGAAWFLENRDADVEREKRCAREIQHTGN